VCLRRHWIRLSMAAASLCAVGMPVWAQTTSVSGEVTDPTAAVIADAVVKLSEAATKQVLTDRTNAAGRYFFSSVAPGTYSIAFSKTGFSTRRIDNQHVDVGLGLTINTVLEVGSVSTVVEVGSASGAELQILNSTVSSVVSGESLILLPNAGRDAATFAILQPGVSPEGANAGGSYDQNTFRLDGGNNSNDVDGSSNIYTPSFATSLSPAGGVFGHNQGQSVPTGTVPTPVESIEEIKVASSGMTADFNSSSGSEIEMVTKRGANQFHGSVYEYYFSSNVGAANSWDNNHTPKGNLPYTPLPITHNNRFGVAIGGPVLPKIFGGKTYFFFNYEGFRFPQTQLWDATVPTALMRAGVIQINQGGTYVPYNLNPYPVTVGGVTYAAGICPGACDPRGIGLNPIVSQIWQKFMPLPNNFSGPGDHYNTAGYLSVIKTPVTSNNFVGRIDHSFGEKWHWFASYRAFHADITNTSQVDIGGAIGNDKLGVPVALSHRPQVPSYWVTGLTTNISPTTTNTFTFSFLRNFWQWGDAGAAPQLPSLGSALEIGGESPNALIPYNIDTADTRQRFWDGHDTTLRDDVTKIAGNHLVL
jgi:Carboxypeptidase regulatory-like domain